MHPVPWLSNLCFPYRVHIGQSSMHVTDCSPPDHVVSMRPGTLLTVPQSSSHGSVMPPPMSSATFRGFSLFPLPFFFPHRLYRIFQQGLQGFSYRCRVHIALQCPRATQGHCSAICTLQRLLRNTSFNDITGEQHIAPQSSKRKDKKILFERIKTYWSNSQLYYVGCV